MSNLGLGALAAFSVATLTFVGMGFGSVGADVDHWSDPLPHEAVADNGSGDNDESEDHDDEDSAAVTRPTHRRVRRERPVDAEIPLGETDEAPPKTQFDLPTNLPKLTNHLPATVEPLAAKQQAQADAVAFAHQAVDAMSAMVARLEQCHSRAEVDATLVEMQKTMKEFQQQWEPLKSSMDAATLARVQAVGRDRAKGLAERISAVMLRYQAQDLVE